MSELKTEPGWKPARERRPWWAAALVGGFGAGVALAGALGLSSMQAHGQESPPVRSSGISLPPGTLSLDERLNRIETHLVALGTELTEIKQRLPPKRP